ncbi:MAG: MlaD family protein [Spirochaetia bacterium]
MKAPGKLARAVIFVGVCVGLLAVFFASVVGDEWLRQYETYYIEFVDQSVSGLEIGGAVQYRGINVGEVRDIRFSDDNSDIIVVEISAQADVPIRSDVTVAVEPVGISGISRLQLSGGSREAPYLEPGDRLTAEISLFETLTGSAENVAGGVEQLVYALTEVFDEGNREDLSGLLGSLRRSAERAEPGIISIVSTAEESVRDVEQTVQEVEQAAGTLNAIAGSLEREIAGLRLGETAASLNRSVENIETIVDRSGRTVDEIDLTVEQNRQALTRGVRSFQRAMNSLSDIASQVNDDPSLLLRGRSGGSVR